MPYRKYLVNSVSLLFSPFGSDLWYWIFWLLFFIRPFGFGHNTLPLFELRNTLQGEIFVHNPLCCMLWSAFGCCALVKICFFIFYYYFGGVAWSSSHHRSLPLPGWGITSRSRFHRFHNSNGYAESCWFPERLHNCKPGLCPPCEEVGTSKKVGAAQKEGGTSRRKWNECRWGGWFASKVIKWYSCIRENIV